MEGKACGGTGLPAEVRIQFRKKTIPRRTISGIRRVFQRISPSRHPRQPLALLIVGLILWDLCFHFLSPLIAPPPPADSLVRIAARHPEGNSDSHPDCGFPDHGSLFTHHHHFPGLGSTAHFTAVPTTAKTIERSPLATAVPVLLTKRSIRAPPSA